LKITLLGTAYPFRGGLASYNERLIRQFNNEGHQGKIETFTLQYPGFLFPGKTQYADWEAPDDLEITESVNSVNPLNWIKIGLKIKKQKPDILVIKYWLPFMAMAFGSIARIVKTNKHTKVISILDNIIPHESRPGDKLLSKYFVGTVDAFVGMSQSVLNDLNTFTKEKPRAFSPHPLFDNFGKAVDKNTAADFLKLPKGKSYMLFFGLIREYKGLDLVLKAMADKMLEKKDIKLLIAGEFYSDSKPYLDLIEKYNLKDRVILHDKFVADQDVKYYFGIADIIVQPYKTATQSGVTQIAYHFEKAMLVTNVGGLAEIVPNRKVGFVVEPDPKEIAAVLNEFYEENMEEVFHENILEEKKKYEWSKMTQTIINLSEKV